MDQVYCYLGDRLTEKRLKGRLCVAVKNKRGKCVRGRNGNMLVRFTELNELCVVLGRRLRKVKDEVWTLFDGE